MSHNFIDRRRPDGSYMWFVPLLHQPAYHIAIRIEANRAIERYNERRNRKVK